MFDLMAFAAAYLLIGLAVSVFLGLNGFYDYSPVGAQIKPNTLKYMLWAFWFVPVAFLIGYYAIVGVKGINKFFNKIAKVRT